LFGKNSFDCEFISDFPKRPADCREKNSQKAFGFDIQVLDTPFPGGKTGGVPCHAEHVPNSSPDKLRQDAAEEDVIYVFRKPTQSTQPIGGAPALKDLVI
jgi:hypothetical protein